ncbi:hypothetical protein BBSC_2204 [Bifidobacterium scardovii JCM 12489 = DSM 13734]|nr:hypothetical protein BBSC_2204 [Bifidobacterium scardovii JCM 12489 = DSM 13734]
MPRLGPAPCPAWDRPVPCSASGSPRRPIPSVRSLTPIHRPDPPNRSNKPIHRSVAQEAPAPGRVPGMPRRPHIQESRLRVRVNATLDAG